MKKLLLILLFPTLGYGQQLFTFRPYISTTVEDSMLVTSGSDTVFALAADIIDTASVVAGVGVLGAGIPFGTKVVSLSATGDTLIIDNDATATSASQSLSFGYFTGSQAYQASDALGWPFLIPNFKVIYSIVIVDDATQLATSVIPVFFNGAFTPTMDNAAFTPSDADADKIIGVTTLATSYTLGANKVWTQASTALPIYLNARSSWLTAPKIYCQLVAGGIGTFTAIDNLTVNIIGE